MPETPTIDAEATTEENASEFVTRSAARVAVLERLVEGPAAPDEIAAERSVSAGGAKNAAAELRDHDLTELLVTDDKRVYGLTAKGERTLFFLETEGKV